MSKRPRFVIPVTVKLSERQFRELEDQVERKEIKRAELLRRWITAGTAELKRQKD